MNIAASQFAASGLGHRFRLRAPLTKVGASRCAECGAGLFEHGSDEVSEADALAVVNVTQDARPTVIVDGELMVGGFKAALAECGRDAGVWLVNCAGHHLHALLPNTKPAFDALRAAGRVLDLEWQDDDAFVLPPTEVMAAVAWMRARVADGHAVCVNCAQGRSRSGALAVAYLMATRVLRVEIALAAVRCKRPFVQPNESFLRQLKAMEAALRDSAAGAGASDV